jgi:L-lactate permease
MIMAGLIGTIILFIIALLISAVIIYIVTRVLGEKEDLKMAIFAALTGTIIYTIVYFLIGHGLIASILGGIAWLIALRYLYKIGWVKALITAAIIWILAAIAGWFLPTLVGPI